MDRIVYRTISGYCPETGRQMSVDVGFQEIRMVGNMTAARKKVSFRCEHFMEHGCAFKDNCPIFKSAVF